MKVLFVGAYDSSFKWAQPLEKLLIERQDTLDYYSVQFQKGQEKTESLRKSLRTDRVYSGGLFEPIHSGDIYNYDAVFIVLDGSSTANFISKYHESLSLKLVKKRPIIVAAYAGIILENIIGGFLKRCTADFVCANSLHDARLFKDLSRVVGCTHRPVVLTGLPFIPPNNKINPIIHHKPQSVVFADQPNVPPKHSQRAYILQNLITYAKKYPERKVLLKPRHRPGSVSFNKEIYPYTTILNQMYPDQSWPDNFIITYKPISKILPSIDLLLTVSSTAAIESLYHGKMFNTLIDFNHDELGGWSFFYNCGRAISLSDFLNDNLGQLNMDWVLNRAQPESASISAILRKIDQALQQQATKSTALPLPKNKLNTTNFSNDPEASSFISNNRKIDIYDYRNFGGLPENKIKRGIILLVANTFATLSRIPGLNRLIAVIKISALLCWIKNDRR